MNTVPKKNTKWIIFGCIVFVLAILIAVGPVLITKYMRAKWQDSRRYKTSHLLMEVAGTLKKSQDNKFYLKGDNDLYYVLDLKEFNQNIDDKLEQQCTVLGKIKVPKADTLIDGNVVRLILVVQKIAFGDDKIFSFYKDVKEKGNTMEADLYLKQKALANAKLRLEVNTKLNKPIAFNVIKGELRTENRKTLKGEDVVVTVLKDEFGDDYMLYKKGVSFAKLEGKDVICLGKYIATVDNMPLVVDEVIFEIYEMYDLDYNRIF